MTRYNIFYQIHKGLRAMMYEKAGLLQQTDFSNEYETETVLEQMEEVLNLFERHAHTEDNFILSLIEVHDSSAASLFEEEHVQDHELGNRMRSLLNMFAVVEKTEDKEMMGSAIRFAFVEFLVFNLKHMAKEEDVLNNLLWKYNSDEQLMGITQQITGHLPPEAMQQYSHWMLRGLSNNEITGWLKEVKNTAPDFVFKNLFSLAEAELPEARWHAVKEVLCEGAMLA